MCPQFLRGSHDIKTSNAGPVITRVTLLLLFVMLKSLKTSCYQLLSDLFAYFAMPVGNVGSPKSVKKKELEKTEGCLFMGEKQQGRFSSQVLRQRDMPQPQFPRLLRNLPALGTVRGGGGEQVQGLVAKVTSVSLPSLSSLHFPLIV